MAAIPSNAQPTQISEVLTIHVSAGQPGQGFKVFVENKDRVNRLEILLSFGNSSNLKVDNARSMDVSCVAQPAQIALVAQLIPKSANKASGLSWSVKYKMLGPDPNIAAKELAELQKKQAERIRTALKMHTNLMDAKQDPFSLTNVRQAVGHKVGEFCDIVFCPVGVSTGAPDADKTIGWKRPVEIYKPDETVRVFHESIMADDIKQGQLGNCWFLCALAAVVEFPVLIDRLFALPWPKDDTIEAAPSDPLGLYELRLCLHGQWMVVSVDDLFPCKPGGGPIYSRAAGPELWVQLVEKAYAKLHGSYYNLRLGLPVDGLKDITGAPSIRLPFATETVEFDDLWSWDRNSCLMCASTPGEDTLTEGGGAQSTHGLVPGHAYTVVQARVIKNGRYKGAQVLQLRNPWGKFEWGGAWSDRSQEMAACKAELDDDGIETNDGSADTDPDTDGIFWMSYADFKRQFISVSVCAPYILQPGSTLGHPTTLSSKPSTDRAPPNQGFGGVRYVPERIGRRKSYDIFGDIESMWHEERLKALFTYQGTPDGPLSRLRPSHGFLVRVPVPSGRDAVVSMFTLVQIDERTPGAPGYIDVGLALYRIEPGGAIPTLVSIAHDVPEADRSSLVEAYLPQGDYLVVPITGGSRPSPPATNFPNDPLKPEALCPLSSSTYATLRRVFFALDADMDQKLGGADLKDPAAAPFISHAKVDVSSRGDQKGAILKLADFPDGFGLDHIALALLRVWGPTGPEWMRLFKAMGYSSRLSPTRADIPYVLAMHSSQPNKIRRVPLPVDVYDRILCDHVKANGKQAAMGPVTLYTLATRSGAIFAGESTSTNSALELIVDCSGSANVMGDRGELKSSCVLAARPAASVANEPKFILSVSQADHSKAWSWKYKCQTKNATPPRAIGPITPLATTISNLVREDQISSAEREMEDARKAAMKRALDMENQRVALSHDVPGSTLKRKSSQGRKASIEVNASRDEGKFRSTMLAVSPTPTGGASPAPQAPPDGVFTDLPPPPTPHDAKAPPDDAFTALSPPPPAYSAPSPPAPAAPSLEKHELEPNFLKEAEKFLQALATPIVTGFGLFGLHEDGPSRPAKQPLRGKPAHVKPLTDPLAISQFRALYAPDTLPDRMNDSMALQMSAPEVATYKKAVEARLEYFEARKAAAR